MAVEGTDRAEGRPTPTSVHPHALGPRGEQWLETLKRRLYIVAFTVVAFAMLVAEELGTAGGTSAAVNLVYGPIGAILALLAAGAFAWSRLPLATLEAVAYLACATALLARVAIVMVPPQLETPVRFLVADFAPWMAPLFILAFLMLDSRRALQAGVALYLALLSVAVTHVAMRGLANLEPEDFNALAQCFVTANAFSVALLFVMARTKEAYGKARYEGEVMARLAHTDDLTGIPNRRHITRACAKELRRMGRHPRPFSVILFDIDHFKRVNDTLGHAVGDEVLRRLAATVLCALRAGDEFGRYGGEEFLVLAYDTSGEQAGQLAERLRLAIAADEGESLPAVTSSFGVSEYRPGDTLEGLLARADAALYRAKEGGRNRVERG